MMKTADAAAVTSIARSALLAANSADMGDIGPAERALGRARVQLTALTKRWSPHARVRRVARRPIECAEVFLEAVKAGTLDADDLGRLFRATERAAQVALTEAKERTPAAAEKLTATSFST